MDSVDPSALQVVGGFLVLAVLFVLREIVSGALKEAGKDLWAWAREKRSRGNRRCRRRQLFGTPLCAPDALSAGRDERRDGERRIRTRAPGDELIKSSGDK